MPNKLLLSTTDTGVIKMIRGWNAHARSARFDTAIAKTELAKDKKLDPKTISWGSAQFDNTKGIFKVTLMLDRELSPDDHALLERSFYSQLRSVLTTRRVERPW